MSEAQSSSLDQFVEEASRRSKNCRNPREESIVPLTTKSSSISEALSITPSSSTQSTDINDYDSLAVISSALSVSTASLNIDSTVNSITQQHFNTTVTTIDGKKIPIELYKSQQKARSSATIILNRNIAITMDRIEFAQISPYFRAAFYGGFSETKSKLLSFDKTKSEGFLHCCAVLNQLMSENKWKMPNLQWMSLQKAFEILDIASYLLIDPLLTLISDVILSKINADSLVLAYHKAENRHVPLARKLWKIIVRQFDRLLANNTFLTLSEVEILQLLHDKHLNINKNEETAMVRKWITANDYDNGCAVRLREELRGRNDAIGFSENEPRLPNSVLLASGGWSNVGPTMLVETLDCRAQKWVRSELKLFELPRAYHAVINTGEHLFTIGGFNGAEYYRSTKRFNLNSRECIEVAPMYDQRCYVGCGLLDPERIIAIGGYNNHDRLRSAEILHIPKNQWHRIAEMSVRRSDGHCVIMKNVAYAIGGFDGMNCHSSVEYYDPQRDRWFIMSNNMTSRRSGVGAATLEGVVFICGGFDGTSRLQTCEFIDTREGKWHRLRSMNRPRSNFGIEVLNNQVVVAGGYGGMVGTIGETEAYDFRSNNWIELPTMSLRRSALYLTRIENHDIIEAFVRPRYTAT
uniref:BTB domain-containing protein n=2 Tax=Wuchereria bancrofti TaxID=6293 RepID=A0AAF5PVJ0_WUCBA